MRNITRSLAVFSRALSDRADIITGCRLMSYHSCNSLWDCHKKKNTRCGKRKRYFLDLSDYLLVYIILDMVLTKDITTCCCCNCCTFICVICIIFQMIKGYHLTLVVILSAFGIGCGAPRYEDGQTIEEEYPNYDVGYVSHSQLFP